MGAPGLDRLSFVGGLLDAVALGQLGVAVASVLADKGLQPTMGPAFPADPGGGLEAL
jgi:hypothetical protein